MKKIVLLILSICSVSAFAQFENKLNAVVFTGLPIYTSSTGTNPVENVFNDYKSIPYIGIGLDYGFNNHLSIGPNFRFLYAIKDGFSVPTTTFGLEMKYNFMPSDQTISPFISGEFNLTWMSIVQDEINTTQEISPEGQTGIIHTTNVIYKPATSFRLDNVSGFMIGFGSDFMIKQKYGIFISLNFMSTTADKQALVAELYNENQSKFAFFVIRGGIKFGFLKSKSIF